MPAERFTPLEGAIPPAVVQTRTTSPVLSLVISTSDPFADISQAAKGSASLVVTPSSILGSATRGPDLDLSSEGFADIFEDPNDVPVLKRTILTLMKRVVLSLTLWVCIFLPLYLFFCICASFAYLSSHLQKLLRGQRLQQAWE